jgi:hypothetical protein
VQQLSFLHRVDLFGVAGGGGAGHRAAGVIRYALQLVVANVTVDPALVVVVREGLVAATHTTFRTPEASFAPGEAHVLISARDRFGQPAVGGEETLVVLVDGQPYPAVAQCEVLGCGVYGASATALPP